MRIRSSASFFGQIAKTKLVHANRNRLSCAKLDAEMVLGSYVHSLV